MSRTSQVLKRLGVASVALVTVGAGLPAVLATSASAAPATQITIEPGSQSAATGTCETFTVRTRDNAGNPADTATVTVVLTDPSPANNTVAGAANNDERSAQFCIPNADNTSFVLDPADQDDQGAASSGSNSRSIQLVTTNGAASFGVVDSQVENVTLQAFTDADGNGVFNPNTDFRSATATASFTPGNNNLTQTPNQTANDNVRTITEVTVDTATAVIAGGTQTIRVVLRNANGDEVLGATPQVVVQSGGANSNGTTGNPTTGNTPRAGDTCTSSNNKGVSDCTVTVRNAGTDTFLVYVNQTNGGTPAADATEPQLSVTRTTSPQPNTNADESRFVDLTPEGPVTAAAGTDRVFTATVTDARGRAVQGVQVDFEEDGAGFFSSDSDSTQFIGRARTNALGQATVTLRTAPGESGQSTVRAFITAAFSECARPAGQGTNATTTTAAGNCSDSEVTNFVVATSPSPSAPATATATASPTTSPSGTPPVPCTVPASITLDRDTITATGSAQITVRATPNSIVDVFAYSRPSTTYRRVREISVGGDGAGSDRIVPPTNTRLYAQQRGCDASPSIVLNVRTALSLNVVRTGVRTYRFFGDSLPARPGGLIISLYRVTNDGRQVLTSQVRASSTNGEWVINRRFTGTGRFGFVVRTGQDLQNAPGSSNVRSLLVF